MAWRRGYQPSTGAPVLGWYPLRQAIARYLNISRGLSCTAEQVLITSGYSGSLRLILDGGLSISSGRMERVAWPASSNHFL